MGKNLILICALVLLVLIVLLIIIFAAGSLIGFSPKRGRKKKSSVRKKTGTIHKGTVFMEIPENPDIPQGVVSSPQDMWASPQDMREGCLRFCGTGNWPAEISVRLSPGGVFSIGRHDVRFSQQMSDFEFEAKNKTVSRHQAAIICDAEGFLIQDLNSNAGTIVNGMKLEPGAYYRLMDGFSVSFGRGGANYRWSDSFSGWHGTV